VQWSVSVVAEGDRVLSLDEIVALADAVAPMGGIASGIGTASYGAQLVVEAATADEAIEEAVPAFRRAAEEAGLPAWPVTRADALSELDDLDPEP
jgi:hypothetical protein